MTAETKTVGHDEKVRARAYMIWEAEGCPDGKHLDHWQQAERKIAVEPPEEAASGVAKAAPSKGRRQPPRKVSIAPNLSERAAD